MRLDYCESAGTTMKSIKRLASAAFVAAALLGFSAQAQEAAIRKNLAERLPMLGKIDEVNRAPMAGLYELRIGTHIYYSDAEGNFLIQGALIDTKQQKNLTEEREE